jgi:predicted Zn-dependent protease
MKFVAKQIPEGINTSQEHPLKELFILLIGVAVVLGSIVLVLLLVADSLVRFIPLETEREWFSTSRLSVLMQENPSNEALEVEKYLTQLVENLAPAAFDPNQFTIQVVDSDLPNAFITPGGHIFVTTELFRHVNSENALSMVIAHEMAHQIHRHPIRSMGRGIVIAVALMMFTGVDGSEWVTQLLSQSVNLGLLSFSREQEREADATGLKLLSDYYGHAAGSSYFFAQLNQNSEFRQTGLKEYLSTHPNTDERLAYLKQHDVDNTALIFLPGSIRRLLDSAMEAK